MPLPPLPASEGDALPPAPGYPCTVLLVDADAAATDAAMALLEAEGCSVFPVPSLATAVRLLDLMIAGVILYDPSSTEDTDDTGGFDALLHRAEGVPVVLFSGADIDRDQARAAGFAGVVRKPYDVASLIAAVRAAARLSAEYVGPPRRAPRGNIVSGGR
jgi:DNA-binding response OmpR family regulator